MHLENMLAPLQINSAEEENDKLVSEECGLDIIQPWTEEQSEEPEWDENSESKIDLPEGVLLVSGDMLVSQEQANAMNKEDSSKITKRAAIKNSQVRRLFRWSTSSPVYYTFHSTITDNIAQRIKKAIKVIEDYTCIRFEKVDENEDSPSKFHIKFWKKSGASKSYVGKQDLVVNAEGALSLRQGTRKNFQEIFLNAMTFYSGILHEIMHALGFIHEQERPDRDNYIKIFQENVLPGKFHNFEKMDAEVVDTFDEKYDFNSIMHYGATFMGKKDESGNTMKTMEAKLYYGGEDRVIGKKNSLTDSDVRRLNKLFNCKQPPPDSLSAAIKKKLAKIKVFSEDPKKEVSLREDIQGGVCSVYAKFNKKIKSM